MICPKCQQELISGAQFCNICGYTIPVYSAPEGFILDEESGLYYQIVPGVDQYGQSGEYVTWFYPNSGEYVQSFNPVASPTPSDYTSSVEMMPEAPIEYIIPSEEYPHTTTAPYPVHPEPTPVSFTIPPLPPTPVPPGPYPIRTIDHPKSKRAIWMTAIPAASFIICAALAFFIYGGSDDKPDLETHVSDVQVDAVVQATPTPSPLPTPDPSPTPTPFVVATPTIYLDKMNHETDAYMFGDVIHVTVQGITDEMIRELAFIAIYDHGAPHNAYQQWFTISESSQSFSFETPRYEGLFEMRVYKQDYVYTDETFLMSIPFRVTSGGISASTYFWFNTEILDFIGQPNSVLIDINGVRDCRAYTDGAISETFHADYLGAMVRFPFNFQLAPDNTDITGLLLDAEMAADEAGRPYFGNSWPDHWVIHGIEAWVEPYYHSLNMLFDTATGVPMNRQYMERAIADGLDGNINHVPRYEQHQRDFGMDIWQAFFYYEDYIVYAIFETYSGEDNLMCLQIYRR